MVLISFRHRTGHGKTQYDILIRYINTMYYINTILIRYINYYINNVNILHGSRIYLRELEHGQETNIIDRQIETTYNLQLC